MVWIFKNDFIHLFGGLSSNFEVLIHLVASSIAFPGPKIKHAFESILRCNIEQRVIKWHARTCWSLTRRLRTDTRIIPPALIILSVTIYLVDYWSRDIITMFIIVYILFCMLVIPSSLGHIYINQKGSTWVHVIHFVMRLIPVSDLEKHKLRNSAEKTCKVYWILMIPNPAFWEAVELRFERRLPCDFLIRLWVARVRFPVETPHPAVRIGVPAS